MNGLNLRSLFLKLFLVITLLIALILWLISTEYGLKASLWLIRPLMPKNLSVAAATGKWIESVTIYDVEYKVFSKNDINIQIKKVILTPFGDTAPNKICSNINFEIYDAKFYSNDFSLTPIQLKHIKGVHCFGFIKPIQAVTINQLEGSWKNTPLTGFAKLDFQPNKNQNINLWLALGENQLKIFKNPVEPQKIVWELDLKDIENWEVHAAGFLSSTKKLAEWQGEVTKLSSNSIFFGNWELAKACPIAFSPHYFEMQTLELHHQSHARATALLAWQKLSGLQAEINIPDLPLQSSQYTIHSKASLYINASQKPNQPLSSDVKLKLSSGKAVFKKNVKSPKIINYQGGELLLQLHDNILKGEFNFRENAKNFIKLAFNTQPITTKQPLLEQSLAGTLLSEYKDLQLINLFIPQISRLQSSITLSGTINGTLKSPELTLLANAKNLTFYIPKQAVQISRLNLALSGTIPGNLLLEGSGYAGRGQFTVKGIQNTAALSSFTLELAGKNIQIYDTSYIQAKANPKLKLHFLNNALHVEGTVGILDASITIKDEKNIINASKDVVFLNQNNTITDSTPFQIIPSLYLELENNLHFKGFGLDGLISGKLAIEKRADGLLSGTGRLTIKEGKYRLQGATRYINRGYLLFPPGTLLMDPILDIRVLDKRLDKTENKADVGIYVQGTLRKPLFNLYSNSNMHGSEIMSRLGFGNSQTASEDESQKQLLSQTAFLLAGSANPVIDFFQYNLELEEFSIESRETQKSFNTQGGTDTVLILGKSLSKKLYLQYLQNVLEPISTVRLRYSLSPRFSTSIETGTEGLGGDLTFSLEKD